MGMQNVTTVKRENWQYIQKLHEQNYEKTIHIVLFSEPIIVIKY